MVPVIPTQYTPVIPTQYTPVIPAKAGIYGGKGLDPRLRGDDDAGPSDDAGGDGSIPFPTKNQHQLLASVVEQYPLWEMGFARRMAPQAPG